MRLIMRLGLEVGLLWVELLQIMRLGLEMGLHVDLRLGLALGLHGAGSEVGLEMGLEIAPEGHICGFCSGGRTGRTTAGRWGTAPLVACSSWASKA